ncbi:hypothetical protein BDF14DRAFT_1884292 [Spinellus fusiger]|nr:hypothetical protein BDF14DRAFT_1884292 [Spinellus fusiger]
MPTQISFADNFWEDDKRNGTSILIDRMNDAKQTYEILKETYEARATLEEEYARRMTEIANNMKIPNGETGKLKVQLEAIQQGLLEAADTRLELSNHLQSNVTVPLHRLLQKQKKMRAECLQTQSAMHKVYNSRQLQAQYVIRARERYNSECAKANDELQQCPVKERKSHYMRLNTVIKNLHSSHEEAMENLDTIVKEWNAVWPTVCGQLQQLEEERITFLKGNIMDYHSLCSDAYDTARQSCEIMKEVSRKLNVNDELNEFVRERRSSSIMPTSMDYISFVAYGSQNHEEVDSPINDTVGEETLAEEASAVALNTFPQQTTLEKTKEQHDPLVDPPVDPPVRMTRMEIYDWEESEEEEEEEEEEVHLSSTRHPSAPTSNALSPNTHTCAPNSVSNSSTDTVPMPISTTSTPILPTAPFSDSMPTLTQPPRKPSSSFESGHLHTLHSSSSSATSLSRSNSADKRSSVPSRTTSSITSHASVEELLHSLNTTSSTSTPLPSKSKQRPSGPKVHDELEDMLRQLEKQKQTASQQKPRPAIRYQAHLRQRPPMTLEERRDLQRNESVGSTSSLDSYQSGDLFHPISSHQQHSLSSISSVSSMSSVSPSLSASSHYHRSRADPQGIPPADIQAALVKARTTSLQSKKQLHSGPTSHTPPGLPPADPVFIDYAMGMFDYKAEEEEELSFSRGDTLGIVVKHVDGWWSGHLWNEQRGWSREGRIPSNYLTPHET